MHRTILAVALAFALAGAGGAVHGQSIDPPDAARETRALATSQARLAWLLVGAAQGADAMVSPAGLASVFSAFSEGADARMKGAIVKTLGFQADDAKFGLAAIAEARDRLAKIDPSLFVSQDLIVFAPGLAPKPDMREKLASRNIRYEVANLGQIEAINAIDAWVGKATHGMIPEILGQTMPDANLVAINALHFKAKWKIPFNPAWTKEEPFTGVDKRQDNVAMMHSPSGKFAFRDGDDFVGVSLPFAGLPFSLVVVTSTYEPKPAKAFDKVSSWLSGEGFTPRQGDVALPRMSLRGRASLLPTLAKAGLAEGMASPTAFDALAPGSKISEVLQRASFDVTEEGAEAAAATAVILGRSVQFEELTHIVVDKPFIYALRDNETGLIVIAGYVGRAPKQKQE